MKRFIILFVLMLIPSIALALPGVSPKKAVWDANTETDLAGYYLYWGVDSASFSNTDRVDVGNVTEWSLGGIPGPNIAITAYDTTGNESEFSNVVPLDNTAPSSNSTLKVVKE